MDTSLRGKTTGQTQIYTGGLAVRYLEFAANATGRTIKPGVFTGHDPARGSGQND